MKKISLFLFLQILGALTIPQVTTKIKKIIDIEFITSIGGIGSLPGKFLFPTDIAVLEERKNYLNSRFDELLIVDKNNHRIQKFDISLDYEYLFGNFGYNENQLNSPWAIALMSKRYILISDSLNHRIVKYDVKGNFIGIFNLFLSKLENLDTSKLKLNEPKGIDIANNGDIYIADSGNDRIVKFSSTGYFLSEIRGDEFGADFLLAPSDVKVDDYGNIYIADTGNNRVLIFDNFNRLILKIENLKKPQGVLPDNFGNIFISDTGNNRVVIYNIKGEFFNKIDYKFNAPVGLAISVEKKNGKNLIYRNLYVADSGNHQIALFRIKYVK